MKEIEFTVKIVQAGLPLPTYTASISTHPHIECTGYGPIEALENVLGYIVNNASYGLLEAFEDDFDPATAEQTYSEAGEEEVA